MRKNVVMMKMVVVAIVIFALTSVALSVGSSAGPTPIPTPAPAGSCDWTGTWQTNWGEMVLSQAGTQVSGSYTHDAGRITGALSGSTLIGTWSEAPSYSPPNDAGDVQLTIAADCNSFTGIWRYGSSGDWVGDWTGTRSGAAPTIDSDGDGVPDEIDECDGTPAGTEVDEKGCPVGLICVDGVCVCPPGLTNCNGICVNTNTNALNCGSCGSTCPSGQICKGGVCIPPPCVADFRCSPRTGVAPMSVECFDYSYESPVSWTWDFGDGTTSTEQNPVHIYTVPGRYVITLRVECASGVIDTLETYVDVELLTDEEECRADFLIEQNRCRFQFFDISQGDPVEWQWDFGDSFAGEGADTSTAQNPAYGYLYSSDNAPGGSYQVTLTIRCRDGNESSISKDVQCEKGNQSINCSWDAPSSCNQWNKSSNPDYAYVLFLTDPPGATIFIDGYSNPCTTPAVVELWEQGSLKILVRKNDECDCEDLFDIINVVHGGVYCREYTLRCRGGPHVEQESQQVTDLQGTMTTDPQGNLYVIDYGNGTVILIGPDGTATTYASGIDRPMSPIFDDKGNLYVGSFNGNIYKISPTGEKIVVASNIWSPQGMDLDHNGNLYVACGYDGNIYKIFPDGAITSTFSGFAHPTHLAVYADGNIYVVDSGGTLIVRITPEGEKASLVDLGETILGMATDGEYLYVSHSDKISRIDTSGQVTHIATDLDQPSSLTVCNGSVFVTVSDGIVKLKISKQTVCASAKISITSGSEFKRANFTIGGTEPQKVSITSHADNFAIMAIPDMRIVYRVTDGSKSSGSLTLAPGTYILSCSGGGVAYLESATVCIEYPVVTGTPLAPTP